MNRFSKSQDIEAQGGRKRGNERSEANSLKLLSHPQAENYVELRPRELKQRGAESAVVGRV